MKFIPFLATENNMDKLYDYDQDFFILKTKCGEIISCSIRWQQGRAPNYYFYSDYFDQKVDYEDIIEIVEV